MIEQKVVQIEELYRGGQGLQGWGGWWKDGKRMYAMCTRIPLTHLATIRRSFLRGGGKEEKYGTPDTLVQF